MVQVFTSPTCVQCKMTKARLRSKGIEFEEVNVLAPENESVLQRLRNENKRNLPVVETKDNWWTGFQPQQIDALVG